MVLNMKETGRKICNMEKGKKRGQMLHTLMGSIRMARNKDKGSLNGQMGVVIKVNFV